MEAGVGVSYPSAWKGPGEEQEGLTCLLRMSQTPVPETHPGTDQESHRRCVRAEKRGSERSQPLLSDFKLYHSVQAKAVLSQPADLRVRVRALQKLGRAYFIKQLK